MMTKPHRQQQHYLKGTYYSFNYCTSIFIMHQSSSTRKQKKRKVLYKQIYFILNYYDKTTLKLKTKTEKLLPIKKYADLTTKEKSSSSIYLQQNKPLTNSEIDRIMKEGGPETFVIDHTIKKY
jgi:hypothetical protein